MKAIPGYEGRYSASADGRIWSHLQGRWLQCYLTNGYERVDLRKDGMTVKARVHRLVALAWIANHDALSEVNHRDGNKRNNAAANLEWVARATNLAHSYRAGLRNPVMGGAKLAPFQVAAIRARLAGNERPQSLAKEYGVTTESINRIGVGRTWRAALA